MERKKLSKLPRLYCTDRHKRTRKPNIDAYGINLKDYQKGKISFSMDTDYREVSRNDHKSLCDPS